MVVVSLCWFWSWWWWETVHLACVCFFSLQYTPPCKENRWECVRCDCGCMCVWHPKWPCFTIDGIACWQHQNHKFPSIILQQIPNGKKHVNIDNGLLRVFEYESKQNKKNRKKKFRNENQNWLYSTMNVIDYHLTNTL